MAIHKDVEMVEIFWIGGYTPKEKEAGELQAERIEHRPGWSRGEFISDALDPRRDASTSGSDYIASMQPRGWGMCGVNDGAKDMLFPGDLDDKTRAKSWLTRK